MSNINDLVYEALDLKTPDDLFDKKEPDESASYVPTFIKDWLSKFKKKDSDISSIKKGMTPECTEDRHGEFKCTDRGYDKE